MTYNLTATGCTRTSRSIRAAGWKHRWQQAAGLGHPSGPSGFHSHQNKESEPWEVLWSPSRAHALLLVAFTYSKVFKPCRRVQHLANLSLVTVLIVFSGFSPKKHFMTWKLSIYWVRTSGCGVRWKSLCKESRINIKWLKIFKWHCSTGNIVI